MNPRSCLAYARASRLRARAHCLEARSFVVALRAVLADPELSAESRFAEAWNLAWLITGCRSDARRCRAEALAYVHAARTSDRSSDAP